MKEIAIMKKLQHPNLIRLHEVIDDDENDKLYLSKSLILIIIFLVLDFAEKGEILLWN
jgi:hypothetical protein